MTKVSILNFIKACLQTHTHTYTHKKENITVAIYLIVVFRGWWYCLTKLGFHLNMAPNKICAWNCVVPRWINLGSSICIYGQCLRQWKCSTCNDHKNTLWDSSLQRSRESVKWCLSIWAWSLGGAWQPALVTRKLFGVSWTSFIMQRRSPRTVSVETCEALFCMWVALHSNRFYQTPCHYCPTRLGWYSKMNANRNHCQSATIWPCPKRWVNASS